MSSYRHTQTGTLVVAALGLGIAVTAVILFAVQAAAERTLVGAVLGFLLLCLYLFRSLSVVVSAQDVEVSFGPGVFRKRLPVDDIIGARRVRNPWYFGWGIRLTPRGWMYNASGFDAVEVELKDNRAFRIGTDDPDHLLKAIQAAAGLASQQVAGARPRQPRGQVKPTAVAQETRVERAPGAWRDNN